MTILADLKSSTKAQHDSLESKLDLLRPDLKLETYLELLKLFYGYYYSVEKFLMEMDLPFNYQERLKLPHLKKDLLFLGLSEKEIDSLPKLGELSRKTKSEVMGMLYVLEGSTLGGLVLTKHFSQKFGFSPEKGLAFFSGYGTDTMFRWKEFQNILLTFSESKLNSTKDILREATATFLSLEDWLIVR